MIQRETRSTGMVTVGLVLLLITASSLANSFWFFPWARENWGGNALGQLATLYLPYVFGFVVIVWLCMLKLGCLRACDVGLVPSHIGRGVAATVAMWLVLNLVLWVAAGTNVRVWSGWSERGVVSLLVTVVVGQLLGNALLEEIVYRGFLVPQVQLRLPAALRGHSLVGCAAAIVISQLVFAVLHAPDRTAAGLAGPELWANLSRVFGWGVVFAVLFVATRNLFLTVGFHAPTNYPCPGPEPEVATRDVLKVVAVGVIVVAVAVRRRRKPTDAASADSQVPG